jgi:hypothetical protein
MILLNFSHPITDAQRQQIEALTGVPTIQILSAMPHFDEQLPKDLWTGSMEPTCSQQPLRKDL